MVIKLAGFLIIIFLNNQNCSWIMSVPKWVWQIIILVCCIINQKQTWFPSLLDVLLTRSFQLSWGLVCRELSLNEQSGFINRSAALTRASLPDAAEITWGLVHRGNSLIWGLLGSHPLSRTSPCLWNFREAVGMPTLGSFRNIPVSLRCWTCQQLLLIGLQLQQESKIGVWSIASTPVLYRSSSNSSLPN